MPYLRLKGNGLLVGITLSSGMGCILFGKYCLKKGGDIGLRGNCMTRRRREEI